MGKFFGVLLIVFGTLVAGFTYRVVLTRFTGSQAERLVLHWTNDIELLAQNQKLPEGWLSLKEVQFTPISTTASGWLNQAKPRFATRPEGRFRLEVVVDDWAQDGKAGAVVQYHLVDLSSGNTIWELGRTFEL